MKLTTKKVSLLGLGIALFVVLTMCLQVPIFENYYVCLGYIVMAVYCCSVGVISGTIVGTVGVFLYCLLISGLRGMPGWVIGNIVIGIVSGLTFRYTRLMDNKYLRYFLCGVAVISSTFFGIFVLKSIVEMYLYSQPFLLRAANNIYAFIADVVVLLFAIPFCDMLDLKIRKYIE
jgi:ECF transporter S component (folate family)